MTALQKYEARADAIDSLLCVGLDPDFMKLPDHFQRRSYPQFEFCRYLVDSTHACTAAYKLNIAFFQARGTQGFQELKLITDYLRSTHPDILLLCDAKHGDTFNTNIQYAASVFDCFGFDGVTVHPYMGGDALTPFLQRQDKAIIVLCLNIDGRGFQSLSTAGGKALWQAVAEMVCGEWNQFGNCMLVIGATSAAEVGKARALAGDMTFLMPGVGPQGGDLEASVSAGLNSYGKGLMIVVARGISSAEDPGRAAANLRDRINRVRVGRASTQ
jgi:orotidine-5'-phosphate decarboxylase